MFLSALLSAALLASAPAAPPPLAGKVVVVDPGHQLGNGRHPQQINQLVDAGGFKKACNTTGTSTNGGFPEATFAWKVGRKLERRLERLGATVVMTRTTNSYDDWGPCIDYRGKLGNGEADLKISIHGDGSAPGHHGFHLIVSTQDHGFVDESKAYARKARRALGKAGFARSSYIGGGTALSFRGDLGTLNLSRMPTVMVELGNMRNAGDASEMSSTKGQRRYARALSRGIRSYLTD